VASVRPLKLSFSARARVQIIAIEEYLRDRTPAAAMRVGTAIREASELLRFFPNAGRPGRSAGTREWVVRGLPYVIVYEVDPKNEKIVVLNVFHGAQRRD
jgi:plasmid stabilization system protein ParE